MPTLTIPAWRPAPLNALVGVHFGTRSRRKRYDRDVIAAHALKQDVPRATGRRRVSLRVTYAGRQQARDPDAMWKSTLDALVSCGLLVDDSPRWCELGGVEQRRGAAECTEIILEDVGDGRDDCVPV